jgi:hypothetical protein
MKKQTFILTAIILLKFVLQFILVNPVYDLHRDEYLHLDMGRHLSWGYISVPPFTSWIAGVITILGNGYFWVRFFPALFGVFTILTCWKIVEELNGKLYAKILCSLALLFSVILRLNLLFQPNSFDLFFWTLTYYTIIKYINSGKAGWLLWTGVCIGFGLLSKYNIIFLVLGFIPALLLTEHRRIFKERYFYLSLVITLLVVFPNLLWQYRNHFPTIHQLQELTRTQLVHVERGNLLKEQLLYFISSFFIIIAAFVSFFFYRPFFKYRIFFWSYCISMSVYLFLRAKSYYTIGLYPVLIAFGSVYLEVILQYGYKKYLRTVSIVVVLLLSVPLLFLAFPYQTPQMIAREGKKYKSFGLLRWEDGVDHMLPQDFADMQGWSELAHKVDSVYALLPVKQPTIVLCDNYGEAGAINYYSRFHNINAVSFNADYIYWMDVDKSYINAILVKGIYDKDPGRTVERPLFVTIIQAGSIENPYAREKGTTIYLLKGAKVNVSSRLKSEKQQRLY